MKWVKRIALVIAALLVLALLALGWLLTTGSGLRFALARAHGFTHGALSVQQAQGRLIGPLQLRGVRYASASGLDARIASVDLDLRFWPLLAKRVHLLDLDAEGVSIALPPPSKTSTSPAFSLQPPLDLILDRVHVGALQVRRGQAMLFQSSSIDLAGRWTAQDLVVRNLKLRAPAGHADLAGQLELGARYRGAGQASFGWRVGTLTYAGQLHAHSDGDQAHAELALTAPTAAHLQLQLAQGGANPWHATLDVPRFDPKPLLGSSSAITALALNLAADGDRRSATLTGPLQLNDTTVRLQPLRGRLSENLDTLQLQQATLTSPQIPGRLDATGAVQLAAKPLSANLALTWHNLRLPPDLAGQALASNGRMAFDGSAARFHANGALDIGPPGKLAHLTLDLRRDGPRIALDTLQLHQPDGQLDASGTLALQPVLGWQLALKARHFDPGLLFAGWPGTLDAQLSSRGKLPAGGPDATLSIAHLDGRLRGRPLHGEGSLHLSPAKVLAGHLALTSGDSSLHVDAKPGQRNDAAVALAVGSLHTWMAAAGGRLQAHAHVTGRWPELGIDGHLQGSSLSWQKQQAGNLQLTANVPDVGKPAGTIALDARKVQTGGLVFQRITLHGGGTQASHQLRLDAQGEQLSAALALSGSLKAGQWRGTLSTLDLSPQGLPRWRLQQPAALGYRDGAVSVADLCLTAGDPLLCLGGKRDKAGNLDANYRLRAIPLAMLLDASGYAQLPLRADGTLEGDGVLKRSAAGVLGGHASLRSAQGSIAYTQQAQQPLLGWRGLAVQAQLDGDRKAVTVQADLSSGGRLDGQIGIHGAQQTLDGELTLKLGTLAPLELFSSELARVQGTLDAHVRFGGTLAQPQLDGQAAVNGFAAEIPLAGLKLTHGGLLARTTDARHLHLDGSVQSGKGTLAINGNVGLGAGAASAITLRGSQVSAANIPAAQVTVSPDLVIRQSSQGIDVGGTLGVDRAEVNLDRLRGLAGGNGVVKASPDVVVVDEKQQQQAKAQLPVTARVKIDLGTQTHLVGKGLDSKVHGALTVIEQPGHATAGQGQIGISGTYKAYGQDLVIEHGQLLFASTPIDDPGLDIRAVRKLDPNATIDEGQEVGLLITGTAQHPIVNVFSNPPMGQSDALSYLITGKPLSQVNSGEGNTVNAAAQTLGSAAGNLLAKRVGARLGVDDIGVSSNEALGGSSAFTVGKYLSPRLYLSYGVGLFEPGQVITLRYRLSQRWNFEAQNATDFNRASLNYRIEK